VSEPNDRDKVLAGLLDVYSDVDLSTIAAYREECVKAERERVLAEVERLRTVLDSEESLLRQLSEWLRK
jgi:hypothetical protein